MLPGLVLGWEYLHDGPDGEPRERCRERGRSGWELVAVLADGTYLYKRPLIPKDAPKGP